jgi:hypothetical protein
MSDLPNWVYDVVIELERWGYEHPKLFAQYAGSNEYQKVDDCGCHALTMVPDEVRAAAKVIRAYVSDADHQRGRMGVPVVTRLDADGNPLPSEWVPSGDLYVRCCGCQVLIQHDGKQPERVAAFVERHRPHKPKRGEGLHADPGWFETYRLQYDPATTGVDMVDQVYTRQP